MKEEDDDGEEEDKVCYFILCAFCLLVTFLTRLPAWKGFWVTEESIPVRRVWEFTRGPRGYFSEPGARIKLIRDNYDMKSPVSAYEFVMGNGTYCDV